MWKTNLPNIQLYINFGNTLTVKSSYLYALWIHGCRCILSWCKTYNNNSMTISWHLIYNFAISLHQCTYMLLTRYARLLNTSTTQWLSDYFHFMQDLRGSRLRCMHLFLAHSRKNVIWDQHKSLSLYLGASLLHVLPIRVKEYRDLSITVSAHKKVTNIHAHRRTHTSIYHWVVVVCESKHLPVTFCLQ